MGALRRRSITKAEGNSRTIDERLPLAACWFCISPTDSNDAPERKFFHAVLIFPRTTYHHRRVHYAEFDRYWPHRFGVTQVTGAVYLVVVSGSKSGNVIDGSNPGTEFLGQCLRIDSFSQIGNDGYDEGPPRCSPRPISLRFSAPRTAAPCGKLRAPVGSNYSSFQANQVITYSAGYSV
jgi:hypothetical protein